MKQVRGNAEIKASSGQASVEEVPIKLKSETTRVLKGSTQAVVKQSVFAAHRPSVDVLA